VERVYINLILVPFLLFLLIAQLAVAFFSKTRGGKPMFPAPSWLSEVQKAVVELLMSVVSSSALEGLEKHPTTQAMIWALSFPPPGHLGNTNMWNRSR
jgi:hypothetical protein